MTDYVYNRTSHVMHRLPASESCNTDQIANKRRFTLTLEIAIAHVSEVAGKPARLCRRCFPDG